MCLQYAILCNQSAIERTHCYVCGGMSLCYNLDLIPANNYSQQELSRLTAKSNDNVVDPLTRCLNLLNLV